MAGPAANVNSLRFSQDHGCFSCAMDSGFRVYNVDPLVNLAKVGSEITGSIKHCEMLNRTNLLVVVGGGSRPKFADNTVLVWDEKRQAFILEFTFQSPVLSVRLRRDKMIVTLRNLIHVYNFPNSPSKLFTVETRDNPKGLCEVSPIVTSERQLLVFPGHKMGSIQLVDLSCTERHISSAPITINCHNSNLAYLAINQQGTMVATASERGTLIRIFDTAKRSLLMEFRRGSDPATIYCINFSQDSEFLCCSSDKGTVHVFAVKDSKLNHPSPFSGFSPVLGKSFSSLKALANFTVAADRASICAFPIGTRSSVVAISEDGICQKYVFYPDRSCKRESYNEYLSICIDDDI